VSESLKGPDAGRVGQPHGRQRPCGG
jgi:hypothetical protein